MNKLLTISVAAYNIEQYIDKLINTISKSKYLDKIEVLFVDDGSKDHTKEIADKYAGSFPSSIKVISKENGGHGSTINTGIKNATGKYFRPLDGDDWVDTESLDRFIEIAAEINSDIIICDYARCYSDGKVVNISYPILQPKHEGLFDDIIGRIDWIPYHSIIYKTEILKENDIRLDEHCFYVDSEYDLFPLLYVKTAYYFDEPIYCYRLGLNDQSISPQSRMKNIRNAKTVADRLLDMYKNTYSTDIPKQKRNYILEAVAEQCNWYIESLMMFPPQKKYLKTIKDFDQNVAHESKMVFDKMVALGKASRTIKLLRKSSYIAYWPLNLYKSINIRLKTK